MGGFLNNLFFPLFAHVVSKRSNDNNNKNNNDDNDNDNNNQYLYSTYTALGASKT